MALSVDRPTHVNLAYSTNTTKRIRLGYSKINEKGRWYEVWYTWRSYADLRSDKGITEKTHVYSQPEGGIKINQTLFPMDEDTLPSELMNNPGGFWKAFGREM